MRRNLGELPVFRRRWAIFILSLASMVVMPGPGLALAQTTPTSSLSVVLPEQIYQPGAYDTGPIALPPGLATREHLVCVLSTGAPVEVNGEMMYSVDGGDTWQEWAPFGMSLGEPTWDTKRSQWLQTPDSCSGSGATDTTTWTHVRLFVNLSNAPAYLSATLADAASIDVEPTAAAVPARTAADPAFVTTDGVSQSEDAAGD